MGWFNCVLGHRLGRVRALCFRCARGPPPPASPACQPHPSEPPGTPSAEPSPSPSTSGPGVERRRTVGTRAWCCSMVRNPNLLGRIFPRVSFWGGLFAAAYVSLDRFLGFICCAVEHQSGNQSIHGSGWVRLTSSARVRSSQWMPRDFGRG